MSKIKKENVGIILAGLSVGAIALVLLKKLRFQSLKNVGNRTKSSFGALLGAFKEGYRDGKGESE